MSDTYKTTQMHLSATAGDVADVSRRLRDGIAVDALCPAKRFSMENGFSALMRAIQNPRAGMLMIELLLEAGADPNCVSDVPFPQTPLILAVRRNSIAMVQRLIAAGADVHFQNAQGITAIGFAVGCSSEMVRLLLDAGADPIGPSAKRGMSPIELAADIADFAMVRFLVDAGASAEVLKWNPLMTAIAFGTPDEVETILGAGTDLNARDTCGHTPMLLAIHGGDVSKAAAVFAAGGRLTDVGSNPAMNAFWYASSGNHWEMTRWLIEKTRHLENSPSLKSTALADAAAAGAVDCVRVLLENEVNPKSGDNGDNSALFQAANAEVVALLVAAGCDINSIGNDGYGLLKLASEKGDIEMVRKLVAMGAASDVTSNLGTTALHTAVGRDQREIIRLLLDSGADPNHRADLRPVIFSVQSVAVTQMLLEAGADPEATVFGNELSHFQKVPEISECIAQWKSSREG